ncbi:MAG: substrate-binding domain-containing protein [Armatimonadota bacterium]|nr:substrate-binding domain-containing protein [Armatimonadota bacterium]
MKRFLVILVVIAALVTLLSSCGGKKQPADKSMRMVGVSLLTKAHPFYQELEAAMLEEAKKNNIMLHIQSAENDLGAQTSQVDDFITQKVNAIVICPVDSASIVGVIKRANVANIPVFTADIAAKGGDVVCHIASDNVEGGRLAGEYMVKLLKSQGKIAIVDFPLVTSVQDRTKGFVDAVGKSKIQIVARPSAEGDRTKAMAAMDNILQRHPDIKGVFAINDNTALGVLRSLQHANRKDIVIVGYDGDPEARKAILDGTALKADAVQYPREIGKATIQTVAKHLDGAKDIPPALPVKVGIIDKESLQAEKKQ